MKPRWDWRNFTDIPDWKRSLLVRARTSATFLKRELDHSEPKAFSKRGLSVAKFRATGI